MLFCFYAFFIFISFHFKTFFQKFCNYFFLYYVCVTFKQYKNMETQFNTNNELQKVSFHYDDLDFFEQLQNMVDTINERAHKSLLSAHYESTAYKESLCLKIKGNSSIYLKRNSIEKVSIFDNTIDITTMQGLTIIIWLTDYTVTILNQNIDIDIKTKL